MTNIIIKIALGINKLISGTIIEKHIKWGNRHLSLLYVLLSLLLLVVSYPPNNPAPCRIEETMVK